MGTGLVANRDSESTSNSSRSSLLAIGTDRSHNVRVRDLGIAEVVRLVPDVGLESTSVLVELSSLGSSEVSCSLTDNVTLSHVIASPSESNLVSGSGETLKSADNGSSNNYTAYGSSAQTYYLRGRSLLYLLSVRSQGRNSQVNKAGVVVVESG